MGVLGCPNLPQARISDSDGTGNSAERAGTQGVGVIFAARKGGGAYAGPLEGISCLVMLPYGTCVSIGPMQYAHFCLHSATVFGSPAPPVGGQWRPPCKVAR